EVNGLMTYNRDVIKINPETARLIHQGYFAPEIISDDDIFLEQARIEMKSTKAGEIRYTLDGTEPTRKSPRYSEPILLQNTTQIKAKSFWDNGKQSLTTSFACTKVSLHEPTVVATVKPGITVHYYEGEWDVLPDFSTLTPVFSKNADEINLKPSPRQQDFALRFEGFVKIASDGIYTFYTNSDDGSKLFVSDQLIVTNDGLHGMREESGKIALKAGFHKIAVEFFQKKGGLGLEVYFKGDDNEKQQIPAALFFTE
ncbi:MAG TPA: PA14 domain-containing protein, partial [bacterium]